MFVPDLLHEFELGVWKAVFTHLMQVLYAASGDKIQELNRQWVWSYRDHELKKLIVIRFRRVPTFGRDTICRFSNNMLGMKKLAARDFEDLLQVCVVIQSLIYCCVKSLFSAPSLFLRAFSPSFIIQLFWICYLSSQLGMPTLNYGYTQNLHLVILTQQLLLSARPCDASPPSPALPLLPKNFLGRKLRAVGVRLLQLLVKIKVQPQKRLQKRRKKKDLSPRPSISRPTSFTHLGTT